MKELLGIKQLSAEEIYEILDLAAEMKKYVLKGERRSLLTGA